MIRSSVALVLGLAGIAAAGVTGWQVIGNGKCCPLGCPSRSVPVEAQTQATCAVEAQAEPEVVAQRLEVEALQASAPAVVTTPCLASVEPARVVGTPRVVATSQEQLAQMERKNLARAAYVQKRAAATRTPGSKSAALDPALLAKKQQQLAGQTATVAPVAANPKLGALEPAKLPPVK